MPIAHDFGGVPPETKKSDSMRNNTFIKRTWVWQLARRVWHTIRRNKSENTYQPWFEQWDSVLDIDWDDQSLKQFNNRPRPKREKLRVNWLLADPLVGSGGHMTVYRMAAGIEERGHEVGMAYQVQPSGGMSSSALRELASRHYLPLQGKFWNSYDHLTDSDVLVCTSWRTAYWAYNVTNTAFKVYFVQDFEPHFTPLSSAFKLAENTYRFGFFHITIGPWLCQLLKDEYGTQADYFDFAYDPGKYYPEPVLGLNPEARPFKIAFYAQPNKPRRGFELGMFAFQRFMAENPDLEIELLLFGSELSGPDFPFDVKSLGILNHDRLRQLYNSIDLGVVFSLTNQSLIPFEMMACQCPVLELRSDHTSNVLLDGVNCILADPTPQDIAHTLKSILTNPQLRKRISDSAYDFVQQYTWDRAVTKFEEILLRVYNENASPQ